MGNRVEELGMKKILMAAPVAADTETAAVEAVAEVGFLVEG